MKGSRLFLCMALFCMGTAAFADLPNGFAGRDGRPREELRDRDLAFRIIRRSEEVHRLIEQNARNLNPQQLLGVKQLLIQIEQLVGNSGGYPPAPPRPPMPLPPPPIPIIRRCADEPISVMGNVFSQIKNFAYSGAGLDLMSNAASQYAQEWTQEHSCSEAENWISEGYKIRAFAYSGNGLNLTSRDASQYTQEMLKRRCYEIVDYVSEGAQYYSFAYSGSGLNLSSRDASAYTRRQMEEKFFSCNSDFYRRY